MTLCNLVKRPTTWVVTFMKNNKVEGLEFNTIEKAADYIVDELKVKDSEVDEAITQMYALKRCRAIFDTNGTLSHTERT
jgi:hypothetical protein